MFVTNCPLVCRQTYIPMLVNKVTGRPLKQGTHTRLGMLSNYN